MTAGDLGGAAAVAGARPDSVCRFICEAGGWRVTSLQLHKILYVAQMVHLGLHGERLADVDFEAWDFGPVAPAVERKVRRFGASRIRDVFFDSLPFSPTSRRREVLSSVCQELLTVSPAELVGITHWRDGAWARNYVPGLRGVAITDSEIRAEYEARLGPGDSGAS